MGYFRIQMSCTKRACEQSFYIESNFEKINQPKIFTGGITFEVTKYRRNVSSRKVVGWRVRIDGGLLIMQ